MSSWVLPVRERSVDLLAATAGVLVAGLALTICALQLSVALTTSSTFAALEAGLAVVAAGGALLAIVALRRRACRTQEAVEEAVAEERRRLARDLHDGLAQDLALIALHGDLMARERGAEHPLALAARRAIAASRGTIADLAAMDARTTAEALKRVAAELAQRHHVQVTVRADDTPIKGRERDALVRIAREAIVNAIQHGQAREVVVSLQVRDHQLVLSIDDDGRGIDKHADNQPGRGLGMPAMRERARLIGGHLVAKRREPGGTRIEVSVR
jgi:signal transduction histidine kinase